MIHTTLTFEDFKSLVIEEKKSKLLSQDEVRQMFSPAMLNTIVNCYQRSKRVLIYYVNRNIQW